MKLMLLLILVSASFTAYTQNYTTLTDDSKADALLEKIRLNQATEEDKNELKAIAVSIQNKGQDPAENQKQYKKSIANIDRAIALFSAIGDTLSVANNKKFKGFLLGRNGKMAESKQETETAIALYQLKNMNAEVAVCQFDLARLFEFENKPDSAIYYAILSNKFWKLKGIDLRVLIINNMLVSLLLKDNDAEKAKAIQQESVILVSKPQMQWQAVLDFYFTSMLLFKTINDSAAADDYRLLYNNKIEVLRREGIIAKSYYENNR